MKGRSLFHTPVILGHLPSHNVGSSEGLIGCLIQNYELYSPANPVSHLAATSGANVFAVRSVHSKLLLHVAAHADAAENVFCPSINYPQSHCFTRVQEPFL